MAFVFGRFPCILEMQDITPCFIIVDGCRVFCCLLPVLKYFGSMVSLNLAFHSLHLLFFVLITLVPSKFLPFLSFMFVPNILKSIVILYGKLERKTIEFSTRWNFCEGIAKRHASASYLWIDAILLSQRNFHSIKDELKWKTITLPHVPLDFQFLFIYLLQRH